MIKTPVNKKYVAFTKAFCVRDVEGKLLAPPYQEDEADQIVSALNAQSKCETCGGTGLIRRPDSSTTGTTELCPKCQPATQTGELETQNGQE